MDSRLTHAFIRKTPIGGLGARPVLTGHGDALTDPLRKLFYECSEPLLQANMRELAFCKFVIDPRYRPGIPLGLRAHHHLCTRGIHRSISFAPDVNIH